MNQAFRPLSSAALACLAALSFAHCSNNQSAGGEHKVAAKGGQGDSVKEEGCYQDGPNCLPPIEFVDEKGTVWTPQMLSGKVVIVNFWATWCNPCKHEIPDLARVYRKYKEKGVVMLGLMTDRVSAETLAAFRKTYGLDYPVVRVDQALSESFGHPRNLPTNFVYNRTGHLVFDRPGAITAGALESEIKELL